MLERLIQNWVYASPPVALLMLGLYPFIGEAIAFPTFLSLPVYMLHQYEEHDDNRFAIFLNGMMTAEKRGLSPVDIWVINVVLVWFLLLAAFYLAWLNPGWGVLAGYLLAVNALVHLAWAAAFRGYNPGVWTAALMFVPCSAWIFVTVQAEWIIHVISLGVVVILHASIMVRATRPA